MSAVQLTIPLIGGGVPLGPVFISIPVISENILHLKKRIQCYIHPHLMVLILEHHSDDIHYLDQV